MLREYLVVPGEYDRYQYDSFVVEAWDTADARHEARKILDRGALPWYTTVEAIYTTKPRKYIIRGDEKVWL